MVAESSEFQLTLIRAHRVHFFQLELQRKKRDILSEKRESGMVVIKREFTPESGCVDTYVHVIQTCQVSRNFRESPEMGRDLQVSRNCKENSRN